MLVLVGAALRVAGLFLPYWNGKTLADFDGALVEGLVLGVLLLAAGALILTRPDAEFAAGLVIGTGWFVAALQFYNVLYTIDRDPLTGAGFLLSTLGSVLALAGAVVLSMGAVRTRHTHARLWGWLAAVLGAAAFAFDPFVSSSGDTVEVIVDRLDAAAVRTAVVMVVAAALPLAATRLGEIGAGIAAGAAGVFASQVALVLVGGSRDLALGAYLRVAAGIALLTLAVQLLGVQEEAPTPVIPRRSGTDVAP